MGITVTLLNQFLDIECRVYARLLASGQSYGIGTTTDTDKAYGAADDQVDAVIASADSDVIAALSTKAVRRRNALTAIKVSINRALLNGTEGLVRALTSPTTFASLDAYLTYYNYGSGGTNTALQSPYFRDLYSEWKNGATPTARNYYYECTAGLNFKGTTHTNALRKIVVTASTPASTAGDTISTDYAGGIPKITVSGFAGASDTVTVTGTQYDPATGTRTAGKTWTATVSGNGTVALSSGGGTPASANALICAVSAISVGASITDCTIYAEAHKPTGRLAIPA